ncbi:3-oxoacyl-ACP synthase [Lutimonas zeaxanthinifaciens]|uniref:3-oxoacyl-ACP synthase n=1 Tax=Lutimonas zeaxanthinifaciens TaxID=3060215 RepID=UPI00265D53C7|nr:3-oxoacyl-ACP synthase [Lutimonas sp. YSD2104]WKK65472.1 3-oxoacyl-ACP synthase [Lutimonas sp. YSD2104]
MKIKESLFIQCDHAVKDKLETIRTFIKNNRSALDQESKSSAGDKHETGRAMLHLEMEKASRQLSEAIKMKEILQKIDLVQVSEKIKLGSLIETDQGNFFLSVSLGPIKIQNKTYYAVSTDSPVGHLLLGKETGASIEMGSRIFNILKVQ